MGASARPARGSIPLAVWGCGCLAVGLPPSRRPICPGQREPAWGSGVVPLNSRRAISPEARLKRGRGEVLKKGLAGGPHPGQGGFRGAWPPHRLLTRLLLPPCLPCLNGMKACLGGPRGSPGRGRGVSPIPSPALLTPVVRSCTLSESWGPAHPLPSQGQDSLLPGPPKTPSKPL